MGGLMALDYEYDNGLHPTWVDGSIYLFARVLRSAGSEIPLWIRPTTCGSHTIRATAGNKLATRTTQDHRLAKFSVYPRLRSNRASGQTGLDHRG